uniref:Uncharacterized protein n=1 Tax=Parascaris univalens TaxID=6257 RepID=A0A915A9F1_PARUN
VHICVFISSTLIDLLTELFSIVVITGGAMGIGKGLARKFAVEERAIVCILDINEVEGQRTASEICSDGGRATFFKCDVSNPDSLRLCAKQIRSDSKLGEVDIVVCNAAVLRVGEILEMSDNDFKVTMDVNVLGYIYTIRAFLPSMIERDRGHVVAIASVCSYFGEHLGTAYCTAKFAVRGLMDSLQMELDEKRKRGVAVTTVFPYFTRTSLITDQLNEPFCTLLEVIPFNECINAIADAVLKERPHDEVCC